MRSLTTFQGGLKMTLICTLQEHSVHVVKFHNRQSHKWPFPTCSISFTQSSLPVQGIRILTTSFSTTLSKSSHSSMSGTSLSSSSCGIEGLKLLFAGSSASMDARHSSPLLPTTATLCRISLIAAK